MTATPRKRRLGAKQRRALQLLAGSPFGAAEAIMLGHGFTRRLLAGLVSDGFATARGKTVKAGGPTIKVERYLITDAGRRVIEG